MADNAAVTEAAAATKPEKQLAQVWAGPRSGPEIAKQSEKAGRHQGGACSDLMTPGFFVVPDGSLQRYNSNWRKQQRSTAQPASLIKSFLHSFLSSVRRRRTEVVNFLNWPPKPALAVGRRRTEVVNFLNWPPKPALAVGSSAGRAPRKKRVSPSPTLAASAEKRTRPGGGFRCSGVHRNCGCGPAPRGEG